MNRPEQHPPTVLLDKLRAGLLDDDDAGKASLEAHLRECETCRARFEWPAAARSEEPALDTRLDALRNHALNAPGRKRHHRLVPLAAAAALALVVVAVVNFLPAPENGNPQLAANGEDVPGLYEDLDFYLWLADHKDSDDSST